ncbi:hypothetical protein H7F51_11055 [Novosphingobium flavum]|uniref:Uncharacterized protein n=1 Tax=Novosphingobium flavum TaxID=1778672 RepID=A0A7X1FSB9_9SPHN|nr:hypothetical protein [Novosphingobium flavum]MBC2666055.1 hypothetical protein [Novosphingobium flavum]
MDMPIYTPSKPRISAANLIVPTSAPDRTPDPAITSAPDPTLAPTPVPAPGESAQGEESIPAAASASPTPPTKGLSPVEIDPTAAFRRIRAILDKCDGNRHTRALVAIHACIDEGIDTRGRIVRALKTLERNCDYKHINIILKEATGSNPDFHWWSRDSEGIYTNHPLPD